MEILVGVAVGALFATLAAIDKLTAWWRSTR